MCAVARIVTTEVQWERGRERVHFSNPTAFAAMALEGLYEHCVDSQTAINSFVGSGGVPAIVQLLKKTTCPVTFHFTAVTIQRLLSWTAHCLASQFQRSPWSQNLKLADKFYEAGERKLRALLIGVLKQVTEGGARGHLCNCNTY